MSTEVSIIKQPENWIHYSEFPEQIVMYDKYRQDAPMLFKPKGLWITPEYAECNWFDWCTDEDFFKAKLNFIHDVKLSPNANLLRLENGDDIDKFTEEYGISLFERLAGSYGEDHKDRIRWELVAEKYQGILIPSYISSRRFSNAAWYYSWDCASGCIWDAGAVESITLRSDVSAGYVSRPIGSLREILKTGADLIAEMEERPSKLNVETQHDSDSNPA